MNEQRIPVDLEAARKAVIGGASLAQHLGLSSDGLRLLYVSAIGHHEAGRHAQAIGDLMQIVMLDARNADAWALMGNCLMREGRFADALQAWSLALHLKPSFGSAHQVARTALALKSAPEAAIGLTAMRKHGSTPDQLAACQEVLEALQALRPAPSGPAAGSGVKR